MPASGRFRQEYQRVMPAMFAAVSDLYGRYWGDFFHFAIFQSDEESWNEALERTHRQYLDELRAANAERVLEMACGRGAFTELLASETRGQVLGIDISEGQLRHARRRRRTNLSFRAHDIMEVDRLDGPFDAALCLDAFCYLPDKAVALQRIASVLRPGARLLVVDWCRQPGLNSLQEELVLQPFLRGWAIAELETLEGYRVHLARSGFTVLDASDLNGQVTRNWDLAYQRAVEAVRELDQESLLRLLWNRARLGAEGVRLIKEQFASALYLKAGFDAGFLRYVHLLAERTS
jgi:sterol 24-C-methyltransferase